MNYDSGGAIRVKRIVEGESHDRLAARIEQDGKRITLRGRALVRIIHELTQIAREAQR